MWLSARLDRHGLIKSAHATPPSAANALSETNLAFPWKSTSRQICPKLHIDFHEIPLMCKACRSSWRQAGSYLLKLVGCRLTKECRYRMQPVRRTPVHVVYEPLDVTFRIFVQSLFSHAFSSLMSCVCEGTL